MLKNFLAAAVSLLAFFQAGSSLAEFKCSAQLSYQWKRNGEGELLKVAVGFFEARGADEAAARAALIARLDTGKLQAADLCKKEHENLSGCYSGKLAAMSSLIKSLDFAARKALSDAIVSDCKQQQGQCGDPQGSEPVCQNLAPATQGTPDAESGKKEEKGKKKK